MKIVILDGYTENHGDLSWEGLKEFGEYTVYERTPESKVLERAADADIIVTNKTLLGRDILSQLPKLKFIALLSTGYNVVDIEYAKERGIPVSNIPTYATDAVAQQTFAFILEHYNQIGLHSNAVHKGEWLSSPDFCFSKAGLSEISGKTIGLIGFGRIGRAAAKIANGFNMKILAFSPRKPEDIPEYVQLCDLDTLASQSDIISLHCPLAAQNEKMINADFLSKMKNSALFINNARGGLVDEQALADALNKSAIAGAGLDVLSTEPPKEDNPLLSAKNCFITPHIAWAGFESRERLMKIFTDNIRAFCEGKAANVVNNGY